MSSMIVNSNLCHVVTVTKIVTKIKLSFRENRFKIVCLHIQVEDLYYTQCALGSNSK